MTITIAGTIFGAAIALSLLYWPRTFDVSYFRNGCGPGGGWCGTRDGPPWCLQDCKIVVFDRVVAQGDFPEEAGLSLIRVWRIRVLAALGLAGGLIGGLVGSLRFWSSDPPPRLRAGHWLIGPALINLLLLLIDLPHDRCPALFRLFLSIVIGWAGTVVVVAWGKLLPPWSLPD